MKKLIFLVILMAFPLAGCQGMIEDFFGELPGDTTQSPLPIDPTGPGSDVGHSTKTLRISAGRTKAASGGGYSANLNINHSRYGMKSANISARISISTQTSKVE